MRSECAGEGVFRQSVSGPAKRRIYLTPAAGRTPRFKGGAGSRAVGTETLAGDIDI
jgi:hypothetical protein